ncbi:hypothetical protein PoB_000630400 [Plakobranchus ocellatus]|uniref:Uncharacterized protein n=1 Tax=Plakobranchus ocellatus TaxID=259542 RepID=A0AAV3YA14_9GAST|nr:hypothetical protein PoB_000630400 [Plakobranchus ocellatus]
MVLNFPFLHSPNETFESFIANLLSAVPFRWSCILCRHHHAVNHRGQSGNGGPHPDVSLAPRSSLSPPRLPSWASKHLLEGASRREGEAGPTCQRPPPAVSLIVRARLGILAAKRLFTRASRVLELTRVGCSRLVQPALGSREIASCWGLVISLPRCGPGALLRAPLSLNLGSSLPTTSRGRGEKNRTQILKFWRSRSSRLGFTEREGKTSSSVWLTQTNRDSSPPLCQAQAAELDKPQADSECHGRGPVISTRATADNRQASPGDCVTLSLRGAPPECRLHAVP